MPLSTGDLKKIYPIQNPHKHIYIRKGELQKKEQQKQSRKNEQKLHNNRIKKNWKEKRKQNTDCLETHFKLYKIHFIFIIFSCLFGLYKHVYVYRPYSSWISDLRPVCCCFFCSFVYGMCLCINHRCATRHYMDAATTTTKNCTLHKTLWTKTVATTTAMTTMTTNKKQTAEWNKNVKHEQ